MRSRGSDAYRAANALKPVVFCPPLAIFLYPDNAKQSNLLAGLALSVECDEHARNAVATLEQLLGPATAVVRSGGAWTDPETGQVEDKLHIHFRITGSARGPEALTKLKRARELATAIVGGDPTNVPIVHCIRWPGSYHRKDEPKLCAFEALNPDAEIALDSALAALEAAAPEIKAGANKKKANGKSRDGYAHGGDWARLIQEVLAAEAFHGPLVRLAMRLLKSGMNTGAAVNLLRGLMESADGKRNERWRVRYDDIGRAVDTAQEKLEPPKEEPPPACDLDKLHAIFRKWLGDEYDLEAIDTIVAVAASERLTGDPAWLLIISGPGAAKTESVQALAGCGALVTSTIQSEGALLSATSQKSRAKTATGGLLRKIGDRGIMVIKDVTSILSSDRNVREAVSPRCARFMTAGGNAMSAPTADNPSHGRVESSSSAHALPRGILRTVWCPPWATASSLNESIRIQRRVAWPLALVRFGTPAARSGCGRSLLRRLAASWPAPTLTTSHSQAMKTVSCCGRQTSSPGHAPASC
jgi:hypothetical protein